MKPPEKQAETVVAHRQAELWFCLAHAAWGRGYATEAVTALVDHGFGALALHRIFGDCDPRNEASAGVMRKLGMRFEGHLRENYFLKGEWCDSHLYAVLASEHGH